MWSAHNSQYDKQIDRITHAMIDYDQSYVIMLKFNYAK